MSNPKHTPGPWEVNKSSKRVTDEYGNPICSTARDLSCDVHGSSKEANAQLIATAPELLEALERCYEVFKMDEVDSALSLQCGMAISKAKGDAS